MISRFLREFWDEGYRHTAPGFPLGLTRIVMGLFWLSQLETAFPTPWLWLLSAGTGISLLLGFFTRLGALIGAGLAVMHAVMYAIPNGEPLWPYALLVIVHLLLVVTRSGQNWGVDQVLMLKLANWPGRRAPWVRRVGRLL
jgi:uncharacterized membrane protein YphA (DoxX/SURF4 family)